MSAAAAESTARGTLEIRPLREALADPSAWAALAAEAVEPNLLTGPEMVGAAAGRVEAPDWTVATVRTDAGSLAGLSVQRSARAARWIGPTVVETFWSPYAPLGTRSSRIRRLSQRAPSSTPGPNSDRRCGCATSGWTGPSSGR